MQRRVFAWKLCAVLFTLLLATTARAVGPNSSSEIAKANPHLLRALQQSTGALPIIIGVVDGTRSARALRESPDPEGESERRARRLAAQKRLAEEMPPDQFLARRYYENFSMMAGEATAEGVRALADRSDVAWVVLDERRELFQSTSPQAPQLLIKSDQANAAGFTGRGQTVAVLDTGVDSTIPELGGAPFPNPKVVGGFSPPEPGGEPKDCLGHGTSVAAIVASTSGVAPDAKIYAVKVFPDCEGFTFDSLIIEGIDNVITNRAKFGITAINMSLGGPASLDDRDIGYCDLLQPQLAVPIDAATAAGIVVVVASGNSAQTNRIASPACISSALSVGAVYSEQQTDVRWGILCTNPRVLPGDPVCFSNSTSSLSLLAPGAFWDVPTVGGGRISFSGTSAAAPAVAGAVALLRAARPDLPVSAIAGILRATGKTITDVRNGVATPLIDTLAAVRFVPGTYGNFGGGSIPIPGGGGSATATATVSGFTSPLGTVQAWVQIDHPDPRQLKLTLSGPDGTSVVLHDQTGAAEHPINRVYGLTDAPALPLSAFRRKQANGVWRLTVQNVAGGQKGRILNFSVTLLPDRQPIEPIPAATSGNVLSVVRHTLGTRTVQSDVRLYNPSSVAKSFSLYYVSPAGNPMASKSTRTVGPGQALALNDVVLSEFGFSDSSGQLTIVSDDTNFLATSRAYTRGPDGTFGLLVPGLPTSSGLSFGAGPATANGLVKDSQASTGAGFTEVSGAPVTVRFDVLDGNGTLLASTSRSAEANTTLLIPDIIADRSLPEPTSNFRVNFTVTSPTGRILPFAASVNSATGDGFFRPAVKPGASSDDIIVSQASHLTGGSGGLSKTNLSITNLDTNPVTVTVSLIPSRLTGTPNAPRVYTILPGQTVEKVDALQSEFNLDDPSAAGLRIHPSTSAQLAVSTRTFFERFRGTFGFSVPGVPTATAIGTAAAATSIQLEHTTARTGSQSSFGVTEVGGADANVRVTVKSGETGATLGSKSYSVSANTSFQATLTDILGAGVTGSNIYLQFMVESGNGRVIAYAQAMDNASGNVIYLAAQ